MFVKFKKNWDVWKFLAFTFSYSKFHVWLSPDPWQWNWRVQQHQQPCPPGLEETAACCSFTSVGGGNIKHLPTLWQGQHWTRALHSPLGGLRAGGTGLSLGGGHVLVVSLSAGSHQCCHWDSLTATVASCQLHFTVTAALQTTPTNIAHHCSVSPVLTNTSRYCSIAFNYNYNKH